MQNYPNPFNPTTQISFVSPLTSHISLKIFDLLGREVAVLVNEEMPTGPHMLSWDAAGMPSGIYFYELRAGSDIARRSMMLVK